MNHLVMAQDGDVIAVFPQSDFNRMETNRRFRENGYS
jgi:hypothetical protein